MGEDDLLDRVVRLSHEAEEHIAKNDPFRAMYALGQLDVLIDLVTDSSKKARLRGQHDVVSKSVKAWCAATSAWFLRGR
jgi:hypothetical protein